MLHPIHSVDLNLKLEFWKSYVIFLKVVKKNKFFPQILSVKKNKFFTHFNILLLMKIEVIIEHADTNTSWTASNFPLRWYSWIMLRFLQMYDIVPISIHFSWNTWNNSATTKHKVRLMWSKIWVWSIIVCPKPWLF